MKQRTASEDTDRPRRGLSILGSTGSIGTQTLEIVRLFPDRLRVVGLAAGSNADLLISQAIAFHPRVVCIGDVTRYAQVSKALAGTDIRVVLGEEGLSEVATLDDVDCVVAAIVGFAGLEPVLNAVDAGKRVALANKETLVVAGGMIAEAARKASAEIIPVDSEHSAIFQCLAGESGADVEALVLTASGGPFRDRPLDSFEDITREEALAHPNWTMGQKITIDSATMMNKGLEVIEAHWLFGVPADAIRVLIHPQSIVHSMVSFVDGSTKAQLGAPDMSVPIQYALSYPERWRAPHARIDWRDVPKLDFAEPDHNRFPCLALAYEALRRGGVVPAALNAANEQAVELFLTGRIPFVDIARRVADVLADVDDSLALSIETVIEVDAAARRCVVEHNPSTVH